MNIYVVQPGDTIDKIADMYGVSATKLLQDNEIDNPNNLVPGQTIVIVYPEQTYTVQEGDSLSGIAANFGISVMQLLKYNPFLSNREYIYPGEMLIISYDGKREIDTIGYAYPYINEFTLKKTLPNLTYLSILNYRSTGEGDLEPFFDDSEIIQLAKDYGTIPLMMTTTLTARGEPNIEDAYNILLSEDIQENTVQNTLNILREKGYYGLNMVFNYMSEENQTLYENLIRRMSNLLRTEGYLVFVTINPNISNVNNEIIFEKVDYSILNDYVDSVIFLQFIWGTNKKPPAPISSIVNLKALMDYIVTLLPPEKIILGKPISSYDWELPFDEGRDRASSLTHNSALSLAFDIGAVIQFDDISQTPYFTYNQYVFGSPVQHIVWTIDARSIYALILLVNEYNLQGIGVWNIMIYDPQLWLILNSQYEIRKLLPTNSTSIS
ncbi:MAG: hypothetical protein K0S76_2121 [Herbinix sp.]|jgi:spore germination protein|nr:hypothetical protein [Herbinix sp.]